MVVDLGLIAGIAGLGLAGWAATLAFDEALANDWTSTAMWVALAHLAIAVGVSLGRNALWLRLTYVASMALLAGVFGFAALQAGTSSIDRLAFSGLAFAIGLPPAMWAISTGGLPSYASEQVRDAIRERALPIRILGGLAPVAGLFIWISFEIEIALAIALPVAVALVLTGAWLGTTGARARADAQ